MPITFYCLSGSPFSWKVWLALEHKGLSYSLRVLSASDGDLKAPAFLALNPRGKVPVITDDAFALAESNAILEYLEDQYPRPGAALWPADPQSKALARRFAGEADAYIYPHVRTLVRGYLMNAGAGADPAAINAAKTHLAEELAVFGTALTHRFLAGDAQSAADFALYPMTALLIRIQSQRPESNLPDIIPDRLREWMARVEALPYFAKTTPPHWRHT